MSDPASEHGFCLFCGYALRGLPSSICPECGRAFDPQNPKTFDRVPRYQRRRRRRIVVAVILIPLLVYVFYPRGFRSTSVTFGCPNCTRTLTVKRTEPVPVSWLHVRLPGWVSREEGGPTPSSGDPAKCDDHFMGDVIVSLDLPQMRMGGSPDNPPIRGLASVNGMAITPDSAGDVLKALMTGKLSGMSFSVQPAPRRGPPPDSSAADEE